MIDLEFGSLFFRHFIDKNVILVTNKVDDFIWKSGENSNIITFAVLKYNSLAYLVVKTLETREISKLTCIELEIDEFEMIRKSADVEIQLKSEENSFSKSRKKTALELTNENKYCFIKSAELSERNGSTNNWIVSQTIDQIDILSLKIESRKMLIVGNKIYHFQTKLKLVSNVLLRQEDSYRLCGITQDNQLLLISETGQNQLIKTGLHFLNIFTSNFRFKSIKKSYLRYI